MSRLKRIDFSKITSVLKGMLVGLIAGSVVALFRLLVEFLESRTDLVYNFIRSNPVWLIPWIVVMAFIAIIVIKLVYFEPKISGNGISEIKAHLSGIFNLNWARVLVSKFIGSTLVLGIGTPVGREGPALQIGGVTGQGVNKLLKGPKSQENILMSSGVAAGLSAAFNAPLSGLLLVLEEVHHRFSSVLILSVFSASIVANFIAYNIFGTEPGIALAPIGQFPLEHYLYLVVLGAVLALGGWVFQFLSFGMKRWYKIFNLPPYIIMLIPFIIVILTGLFWPEMLGGGTGVIREIANARFTTPFLLIVLAYRMIAFMLVFGTGIPAGTLVPLLTVGALIGSIYGNLALSLTGIEDVFIRSFVIYGLAGFMSVVNKAPLTGIVLAIELTGSITQLMPISIVSLSAYIVAEILNIESSDEITLKSLTKDIPKVFEGKIEGIISIVEAGSRIEGSHLKEFSFPYNSQISSVKRNKVEFIPHADTIFYPGDEIVVNCDVGFVKDVQKYVDKISK